MTLTLAVLLVLALYVTQLFLQETSRFSFDLNGIVGNRDALPEPSIAAARLERAKDNMREALPLFLGLTILAFAAGQDPNDAAPGATVFLLARIAYVPAYFSGIPWLRSVIWLVGMAGLAMMAAIHF